MLEARGHGTHGLRHAMLRLSAVMHFPVGAQLLGTRERGTIYCMTARGPRFLAASVLCWVVLA